MECNSQKTTTEAIHEFMDLTGCKQVFLYGGSAIDRYLDPKAEIMDYDIAIRDTKSYIEVLDKLKQLGFDVGDTRKTHNFATVAKHKDYGIFDISCMNIEDNGIYNLEKFYIEFSADYPYGKVVDAYNTVNSLKEGKIEIANNPDKEKAYDLLRRFSVLAGKYGFCTERNGKNEETMAIIERRLKETPVGPQNKKDRIRCLSRFLGAAFRRQNQARYLARMGETGLFAYGFPAINDVMQNDKFLMSIKQDPAKDKRELIERMLSFTTNRDEFIDEIQILKERDKDREDPKVLQRVNEFDDEKTSINRLTKHIVNPLFLYIQTKGRK
ncbi:MAG: hypothetical protein E7005_00110 [Alphaproteobacteria bacterium]|nr:hypothetical protein [Alphaproteobacteria bacterium]